MRRGEQTMPTILRVPLAVTFGLWCGVAPVVWAASDTAQPFPRATIVAPDDPTTTYRIWDRHGRLLIIDMPPLGSPAIQVSDSTQGTVGATVLAIDGETNQVKVRTQEGQ